MKTILLLLGAISAHKLNRHGNMEFLMNSFTDGSTTGDSVVTLAKQIEAEEDELNELKKKNPHLEHEMKMDAIEALKPVAAAEAKDSPLAGFFSIKTM